MCPPAMSLATAYAFRLKRPRTTRNRVNFFSCPEGNYRKNLRPNTHPAHAIPSPTGKCGGARSNKTRWSDWQRIRLQENENEAQFGPPLYNQGDKDLASTAAPTPDVFHLPLLIESR